jgi:hypothetical protein
LRLFGAWVFIRVPFHGQFSVGFFELGVRGVSGDVEDLVKVSAAHVFEAVSFTEWMKFLSNRIESKANVHVAFFFARSF